MNKVFEWNEPECSGCQPLELGWIEQPVLGQGLLQKRHRLGHTVHPCPPARQEHIFLHLVVLVLLLPLGPPVLDVLPVRE